jgi:putative hydrolase of the HAD superfamily
MVCAKKPEDGMIFFDIDNTLLDYPETEKRAALAFLHHYQGKLPYADGIFVPFWKHLTETYFNDYLKGNISFIEQRRRRIRDVFSGADIQLNDEEADQTMRVYLDYFESNESLFPDVLPVLDALKDRRLGIISNGEPSHQRTKINHLGIRERFEVIAISDEVGAAKPDAAIFHWAAAQAGLKPEACCHVGDLLDTDAMGAHASGFRLGIWINRSLLTAGPVQIPQGVCEINKLDELLPLLGSERIIDA